MAVVPTRPERRWTASKVIAEIQQRQQQGLSLRSVARDNPALYAVAKRLFGGWNKARCAAGFPPPTREIWTADKVLQTIQARHQQGLPLRGLENHATLLYRAAKRFFGGWQKAVMAAGGEVRSRWTPGLVIATMRLRQQQGLLSRVWRDEKRLLYAAIRRFGSWQNAMQAAGIEFKPRRKWSKELVLSELRVCYCAGYRNISLVYPALTGAAHRFFGSLTNAWETAGLDPPSGRWTKRRVVVAIQDRYVQGQPIEFAGFKDILLAAAANRHFGTWHAAVEAAGLHLRMPPPVVQREWSAQAVLNLIRESSPDGLVGALCKEHTEVYSVARRYFGSWRAAVQAAGLQTQRRNWSCQLVIQEILALREQGLTLLSRVYREDCRLAAAAHRYFGSWRKALKAAGIKPHQVIQTQRKNEKGAVA